MRSKINIDKGAIAIVNELLACGETFNSKKVKRDSG